MCTYTHFVQQNFVVHLKLARHYESTTLQYKIKIEEEWAWRPTWPLVPALPACRVTTDPDEQLCFVPVEPKDFSVDNKL